MIHHLLYLLDKGGGILGLAGQSPVVEHHRSETSLNGVREGTGDAIEGEPRGYVAQQLEGEGRERELQRKKRKR